MTPLLVFFGFMGFAFLALHTALYFADEIRRERLERKAPLREDRHEA